MNKCLALLLPFFARTALIKVLGADFLGISSFMTSVLQVLNMAELGFSSAIVFSLYEPLAGGDKNLVRALLMFYRRVYRLVGLAILVLGLVIAPLIPAMIKGGYPGEISIHVVYGLYLANTAISYFAFAYKNALLTAAQRQDVVSNIGSFINIVKYGAQIAILLIWGDFYAYVAVNLAMTVVSNIAVQLTTKRMFPEIECEGVLEAKKKKAIVQQVKGLAIGQITKATRNSFDAVFLAVFCGLVDVAIYSNYYYVMTGVLGFVAVLVQSMTASIGNSLVAEPLEKNYQDFRRFYYAFSMIGCIGTSCLFCLYQPFMEVWAGGNLVASNMVMVLFCLYFYVSQVGQVRSMYIAAAVFWWEFRWLNIGEAFANVLLNALLGYLFGMAGILIATNLTVFGFSVVGATIVFFKVIFRQSSSEFWASSALYAVVTILAVAASCVACHFIVDLSWFSIILRLGLCLLVSGTIVMAISAASATMRGYLKGLVRNFRRS